MFVFQDCEVDEQRRELRRNGVRVATQPKELELLLYLLRNRDRVVAKDELLDAVWEGVFVSDSSLTRAISRIRTAIRDSDRKHPLIRTHARVGYGFAGPAQEVASKPGDLPADHIFVGRRDELSILESGLRAVAAGTGRFVLLSGEPGIGKTRTARRFVRQLSSDDAIVLQGRCYGDELVRAYGPIAEALTDYISGADGQKLSRDVIRPLSYLIEMTPLLAERIPVPQRRQQLSPEEGRLQFFRAFVDLLSNLSRERPVVLLLDDMHWADSATLTLLRYVIRFIEDTRVLVVLLYRGVEGERNPLLRDTLAKIVSEHACTQRQIGAMSADEIGDLIAGVMKEQGLVAPVAVDEEGIALLAELTGGNPFFIRELTRHLLENDLFARSVEHQRQSLVKLGFPQSVVHVVNSRVGRLSADAARLLQVAAAFEGPFRFEYACRGARMAEDAALDALEECLGTQLITALPHPDSYDFAHALIRYAIYATLSPARRVRVHRRLADLMDEARRAGGRIPPEQIVRQYLLSSELPGAERGADHALAAAAAAARKHAFAEAVSLLESALEWLPADDERRGDALGDLVTNRIGSLDFDAAAAAGLEAARWTAERDGAEAAAEHLARIAWSIALAGGERAAWWLVEDGLAYCAERRDGTWAQFMVHEIRRRESEDVTHPGIPIDSPDRKEVLAVIDELGADDAVRLAFWTGTPPFGGREDVAREIERAPDSLEAALYTMFWLGDYERGIERYTTLARQGEEEGRVALALNGWAQASRGYTALGRFEEAREALDKAEGLQRKLVVPSAQTHVVARAADDLCRATDGLDARNEDGAPEDQERPPEHTWLQAPARASRARAAALRGEDEEAIAHLTSLLPAIERAPGAAWNYPRVICDAADVLWFTRRTDSIDVVAENLRRKVIEPDFRYTNVDGCAALARLCALRGDRSSAVRWFAKSRVVLQEQKALPLLAVVDFDEATSLRLTGGSAKKADRLEAEAQSAFERLGMTGWAGAVAKK